MKLNYISMLGKVSPLRGWLEKTEKQTYFCWGHRLQPARMAVHFDTPPEFIEHPDGLVEPVDPHVYFFGRNRMVLSRDFAPDKIQSHLVAIRAPLPPPYVISGKRPVSVLDEYDMLNTKGIYGDCAFPIDFLPGYRRKTLFALVLLKPGWKCRVMADVPGGTGSGLMTIGNFGGEIYFQWKSVDFA